MLAGRRDQCRVRAQASNIFPQVTAVWATSNTIKTTVGIPGFPDATDPNTPMYYCGRLRSSGWGLCPTPYRALPIMMAAAGDSSRAYLSSCDGGNVNFIDTSTDTYLPSLPVPVGTRAPIPRNPLNPWQTPVFLIAGP